ncbi:hypothetical protein BFR91_06360 [Acinetobacter pittii]|uniref:DUF6651 domain-containing protein n=1 Tax=Acinetobacter pittii TaxID=48296 RepID=UPI00083E3B9D|nr:DUF6651 domain-containing protein [Acinetobacter pittii]ODI95555.1 hypothetical protein BFR91_06360 [Acinetobacter pittii]
MPLWMQLLINGGVLRNPADGEGNDLGGGGEGGGNNDDVTDDDDQGKEADSEKDKDDADEQKDKQPNGGKNKLTDKEAELIKEVMKRKDREKKLLQEFDEFKRQFADIDPELARKAIAAQKEKETRELEEKGEYECVKQSMAQQHQAEVNRLQQQIKDLQQQLGSKDSQINELTIGSNFSRSAYIAEELTLTPNKARALYGAHFEIENGEVIGYDKPRGAANRTALVDSYGNPLSFDKAMQKIIEADPERDTLIRSKVNPGAGSKTKQENKGLQKEQPKTSLEKIMAGLRGES